MQVRVKMHEFASYHPLVNLVYFVAVIGMSMFIMTPVFILISLVCSICYSVMLRGRRAVKFSLVFLLPMILVTILLNPMFNHSGATILAYLPSGNPLTLESVLYGAAAGAVFAAVICWFSCFNEIMTSDKFVYLFGRLTPSLSLILSMTLRFVPRFKRQFALVSSAQKNIGNGVRGGGLWDRFRSAARIVSIMVTWSLESAIDTADSMKSRGYGTRARTSFSLFKFDARDRLAMIYLLAVLLVIFVSIVLGGTYFKYFPSVKFAAPPASGICAALAYFMLCSIPIWIEIWEIRKWKL